MLLTSFIKFCNTLCMHAMYQYTNCILRMLIVYTHYIILKYIIIMQCTNYYNTEDATDSVLNPGNCTKKGMHACAWLAHEV